MKLSSSEFFKEGKNSIGWVGSNFKANFMDMEFEIPKKLDLKTKVLERDMNDKEILAEFKPQESNLGELAYALKNDGLSKNGYANIFYIRDKSTVLWAVLANWLSDGRDWTVNAHPVGLPREWLAGHRIISSDWNFDKSAPSETLKLRNSDAVKITQIEYQGNKYKLLEN